MKIGVDTGSTFADYVLRDDKQKKLYHYKHLVDPLDRANSIFEGLQKVLLRAGRSLSEVEEISHGTTVGINALIERKGARLGLFVTKGFRDMLTLGRLRTPVPYSLLSKRPAPLVERANVVEINERTLWDGTVKKAPDVDVVDEIAVDLIDKSDVVIVCFLHAYANPANEYRLRELITRVRPHANIVLSSEVWPIIREYERALISCIEGYVGPVTSLYVSNLRKRLNKEGFRGTFLITRSDGGAIPHNEMRAVTTLLSGTASGVEAATSLVKSLNKSDAITMDIGGTSTDICCISQGTAITTVGEIVGEFALQMPTVAVSSTGQGGGTIIGVNADGVIKVGPASAGAYPGPACYGDPQATEPTLTDAFCVMGWLDQARLGFGEVTLDRARSEEAFDRLRNSANLSERDNASVAWEAVKLASSEIIMALARSSARAGMDYRAATMIAFGGGGPLFAPIVASEAGIKEVLFPRLSGVLSALGSMAGPVRRVEIEAVNQQLDGHNFSKVIDRIHSFTWPQGSADNDKFIVFETRYVGQSFEVPVELDESRAKILTFDDFRSMFDESHQQLYGFADTEAAVEVVHIRYDCRQTRSSDLGLQQVAEGLAEAGGERSGSVYFAGEWAPAIYVNWSSFRDQVVSGQYQNSREHVVLSREDTTMFIPRGSLVTVLKSGDLMLKLQD
jgi:N-methylhydantoinase A